jgi:hypothetical protein
MEPRVVASPDGAHLAVLRDHKLSLFALDTGRRVGAAEVTGTELAFAGGHLVVHAQAPHASLITVLTLPSLSESSSHEIAAPTRLVAAANAYALLDRGDQAVAPLRPPAAFSHAVGLDGPQFITFGSRGAELWDAASRRPEARLRLELPTDTAAIGITSRYALLWVATSQPCLHLVRISDGRTSTLWLDAPPRYVRSHPVAAWVVADVGGRSLAINLAIGDVVPLDAGASSIVAVAPRRDRDTGAVVVFLDGDALELRMLGGEARPVPRREVDGEPEQADAEVPDGERAEAAGDAPPAAAARGASLRERLGQRSAGSERVIPPAQVVTPAAAGSSGLAERLGGRSRSLGAAIAGVPSADPTTSEPAVDEGEARAAAHPAAGGSTPLMAPAPTGVVTAHTWRDELVAWARRPHGAAPALDGSPLRALHLRLGLPSPAWPIACALYGRWLLGGGARGVATARLAALAGAGWSEALGGALGADGLVVWRHGRACLAPAVGDFLDGRSPSVVELIGHAPYGPAAPGAGRLAGDGAAAAREHAVRLADERGQVALHTGPAAGGELAAARLEAWLRRLTLVIAGDPGPIALRGDEAVIAVAPGR